MFFILSPYVLIRMFGHTALAGNFIILMAMCLWAYKEKYKNKPQKKIILWTLLLGLAATIHLYYVPMVVIIMLITFIVEFIEDKKTFKFSIITLIDACIFALLIIYLLGGFSSSNKFTNGGVGEFNINLNTFINPHGISNILQDMPNVTEGEWEGIGYLGLGIILMCFASIILLVQNTTKKDFLAMLKSNKCTFITLCILVSVIVAMSPTIKANSHMIWTIPFPAFIMKILEIFRANGRFIWIASYSIFLISILIVYKCSNKKVANAIITICLLIQILDFRSSMTNKFRYSDYITYTENNISFDKVLEGSKHIACLDILDTTMLYELSDVALRNNCTMSNFYFARPVEGVKETENILFEDIRNSKKNDDYVYIIEKKNKELIEETTLNCYEIGPYIAITSKNIEEWN